MARGYEESCPKIVLPSSVERKKLIHKIFFLPRDYHNMYSDYRFGSLDIEVLIKRRFPTETT